MRPFDLQKPADCKARAAAAPLRQRPFCVTGFHAMVCQAVGVACLGAQHMKFVVGAGCALMLLMSSAYSQWVPVYKDSRSGWVGSPVGKPIGSGTSQRSTSRKGASDQDERLYRATVKRMDDRKAQHDPWQAVRDTPPGR
jgi:hypothetical protein